MRVLLRCCCHLVPQEVRAGSGCTGDSWWWSDARGDARHGARRSGGDARRAGDAGTWSRNGNARLRRDAGHRSARRTWGREGSRGDARVRFLSFGPPVPRRVSTCSPTPPRLARGVLNAGRVPTAGWQGAEVLRGVVAPPLRVAGERAAGPAAGVAVAAEERRANPRISLTRSLISTWAGVCAGMPC